MKTKPEQISCNYQIVSLSVLLLMIVFLAFSIFQGKVFAQGPEGTPENRLL
ncbi:MAG: hypothetical protein FWG29_06645 [Treponema sp.]|nr:hypothetical protein [Treponema sp.]